MDWSVLEDNVLESPSLSAEVGNSLSAAERDIATVLPVQVRGARAMLGWSMIDLSIAARVSVSTIKRIEDGQAISVSQAKMIRDALEQSGMRFLQDNGSGHGLQLRVLS